MNLKEISRYFSSLPSMEELLVSGSEISLVSGSRSAIFSAIQQKAGTQVLIISEDAQAISEDMKAYLGADKCAFFPSWDTFPTEDISPSSEIVGERLRVLERLDNGESMAVITKIKAAQTRVLPKEILHKASVAIMKGDEVDRDGLINKLAKLGFKRRDIVGERGEFSARGGLIDIFSPDMEDPVRLEFLDNKIESIRYFSAQDQRSIRTEENVRILPLHEIVLDDASLYKDGIELSLPEVYPEFASIFDYLKKDAIIIMDDPETLKLSSERFINEVEELRSVKGVFYLDHKEVTGRSGKFRTIRNSPGGVPSFNISHPQEFHSKMDEMMDVLKGTRTDRAVIIVSKQSDRIYELIVDSGLPARKTEEAGIVTAGISVLFGELEKGFSHPAVTIYSDWELFGKISSKQSFKARSKEGISKDLLAELKENDYVVHNNYGIGIYKGLVKLDINNATQEYIHINYASGDALYVPLHQMGLVEKYTGGGDVSPKIGRLGGAEWLRTKAKAKKSIKDMTAELMDVFMKRKQDKGFVYPPDNNWQMEFEKAFPYEETPDQEKAIREIKKEMENGTVIDRLVCGDVGYGKTEVAIRAAFKTATSGKQVALLCPTTVLADQHFRNFSNRFSPYPVSVELLSRFRTKEDQKRVVKEIEAGAVDVVIGTHRLLQKDIKWHDLGLIIVDEEQKFGVAHKEKIKLIGEGVNIITLSATPIPRTLYMSISGIKEMSQISTPPLDRSPVRTYLREWSENTIKEVVLRELERGGQVYFVHNYVKTIDEVAAAIKNWIPSARIAIGHGQMDEKKLENVMLKFINKEYDILVSTSIIESGLDIPSVNTVIIDHAENFGLAQLYQIRGRVGRSATRAFAYLLYHKEKVLTETALERLKAIQEFTALGSGFKLAMADLEIRGAGNVLGAAQHGHMLNIGFDMYCELLEESVAEIKNIPISKAKSVFIDIKIDAFIPDKYVPDEKQRIALYRRMNYIVSYDQLEDMKKEMTDRFGAYPKEVSTLFNIIKLKVKAGEKGISSIIGGSAGIEIRTAEGKMRKISVKGLAHDKLLQFVERAI